MRLADGLVIPSAYLFMGVFKTVENRTKDHFRIIDVIVPKTGV